VTRVKRQDRGELFFELALNDITARCRHVRAIYDRTNTVDGGYHWKSLRLLGPRHTSTLRQPNSCVLARLAETCLSRFRAPGRSAGIEEAIFSGISVNVTLLFSRAIMSRRRGVSAWHRKAHGGRS